MTELDYLASIDSKISILITKCNEINDSLVALSEKINYLTDVTGIMQLMLYLIVFAVGLMAGIKLIRR